MWTGLAGWSCMGRGPGGSMRTMDTKAHRNGMLIAAIAAGALALSGCGGSNEPETPDEPQTSSAPDDATETASAATGEDDSPMDAIAGTPERLTEPMDEIPVSAGSGASQAAGLGWEAPEGWIVVPTTPGGMRAAQYTAPAPSGKALAPAEVVFFYFGPDGQGGGLSANLERWSTQVLDESGAPVQPAVATFQNDPLDVTTALYTGAYMSGMPGQQRTPLQGWALLVAVVEWGPEGTLFIRMTGPEPTVDAQREAFEVMIRTIAPVPIESDETTTEGEPAQ